MNYRLSIRALGAMLCAVLCLSLTIAAAPGDPDPTFSGDGKLVDLVPGGGADSSRAVAVQADGKIVIAGLSQYGGANNACSVVRLNPNGSLDTTFGGGSGKVTTPITNVSSECDAVAIQPDGKIIAAGYAFNGSNNDFAIVRYNADGSLDTTFDADGKVITPIGTSNEYANAVVLQTNGKIVAAGYTTNGANNDFALVRYNANGSLDTSFDADGKVITPVTSGNDFANAVALQTDGKIVAAGSASNGSDDDFAVVRYNADGSLDAAFGGSGIVTTPVSSSTDVARAVAVQTDGKIIAAGNAFISGANNDFAVVRYNADGSLDASFDADGKVTTPVLNATSADVAYAVAVQTDGKITAVGSTSDGSVYFALVRYNPNGSLDTTFGTSGKVTTLFLDQDSAYAVAVQTDGKIVAAGSGNNGSNNDFAVARYNADGSLDVSFDADGKLLIDIGGGTAISRSVAVQADGKIVAAGYSNRLPYNNFALVRYNADGSLDTTFGTGGRVTTAIGTSNSFVQSVVIQSDGKIVAAGYATVISTDNFAVARYNPDGSLDTTFGTGGRVITSVGSSGSQIQAVAIQTDGRIIAAGFTKTPNLTLDFALARYNADGSLDATFDTDGKVTTPIGNAADAAYAVAIQTNGKIVAAGFSNNGTNNIFALARYNSDGSLDVSFDGDGKVTTQVGSSIESANAVAVQTDGKIVAAGTTTIATGESNFALARYNADGSLDASFDGDGKVITPVASAASIANGAAIQPDGKIVAAGYVRNVSDNDFAVVRYNADGSLDNSYGAGGKVILDFGGSNDIIYGITLDNSGRTVAAGQSASKFAVARFLGDAAVSARTPFDFDGDGRADISVFRPSNGAWYVQQSSAGFATLQFGTSTDKLIPADYDGDGKTDVAVFRNGIWYLQRSQAGFTGVQFGNADDVPVPADYDGDGKADIAVFRQSNTTWYRLNSSNGQFAFDVFGLSTDQPVPADYDGDGRANIAVFRPSSGTWYTSTNPATNYGAVQFGASGDKPVPADYDGDGKTDIAVFRPSSGNWYLLRSQAGYAGVAFGLGSDIPVPADYDGDGKADVAVFRNGNWYLNRSTNGFTGIAFGTSTDLPVPNAFVR